MQEILQIENLRVSFEVDGSQRTVVADVSLSLAKSECAILLGETGSGKSTIARSIINLLPLNATIDESSRVLYNGIDLTKANEGELLKVRRNGIAVIPQNPLLASNPSRSCGAQMEEVIKMRSEGLKEGVKSEVINLFREVGITDPQRIVNSYPHQVSLGQLQRVFIAMALASNVDIIIADEPFSSVDSGTRDLLIQLFIKIQVERKVAILLITHDLGLVDRLANKWYVLYQGRLIAESRESIVDFRSEHPYIRSLLGGYEIQKDKSIDKVDDVLLEARHLSFSYESTSRFGWKGSTVPVLADVSLKIFDGEVLGLVGKSGSGKSTLSRILGGILNGVGDIRLRGQPIHNILKENPKKYFKEVQYLLQDSATALPPRRKVGRMLGETLLAFRNGLRANLENEITKLLTDVHLPESYISKNRSQLSGGEKQRVCLARALAVVPSLLILDESLASLDRSVQGEILELLVEIRERRKLTILLVSHDLELVSGFCSRVVMMSDGRLIDKSTLDRDENHPVS